MSESEGRWLLKVGPMRGDVWDIMDALNIQGKGEVRLDWNPFRGFIARPEVRALRSWLGPGACFGGTVLITGDRGSGKTSGVNRALFDCSVLGVLGCSDRDTATLFETLDGVWEGDASKSWSQEEFRGAVVEERGASKDQPVRLLVPIYINLSRRLDGTDLTRRVVRELYWALVRSGVVAFAPELVAEARKACFRTSATLREISDETLQKSFTNESSFSINGKDGFIAEAAVAVHEEIQIARRMALEFGLSSPAEMDEQLLRLLDEINGTVYGDRPSPLQRVARIGESLKRRFRAARTGVIGRQGVRVSTVFILDEIDKLDLWGARDRERPSESFLKGGAAEGGSMSDGEHRIHISRELEALVSRAIPKPPERDLFEEIITTIKPILTHGQSTFLLVAGTARGLRWNWRRRAGRSVLDSIVSEHVHFGLLDLRVAEGLLEGRVRELAALGAAERRLLAGWLLVACRGSYHRCISLLRRLWVDGCTAEGVLKRPGALRQGLLGLLVHLLLPDPSDLTRRGLLADFLEMKQVDDDAVLWDELRRLFLLIAAGDRGLEGVLRDWRALLDEVRPKDGEEAGPDPEWVPKVLQDGAEELIRWRDGPVKVGGWRDILVACAPPAGVDASLWSSAKEALEELLGTGEGEGGGR